MHCVTQSHPKFRLIPLRKKHFSSAQCGFTSLLDIMDSTRVAQNVALRLRCASPAAQCTASSTLTPPHVTGDLYVAAARGE
jgi:hypothetical protein